MVVPPFLTRLLESMNNSLTTLSRLISTTESLSNQVQLQFKFWATFISNYINEVTSTATVEPWYLKVEVAE